MSVAAPFRAVTVWGLAEALTDHEIVERLDGHTFRAPLSNQKIATGFTAMHDIGLPPFAVHVELGAGLLAFAWRRDEKKLPSAAVKLMVDKRAAAWCADNRRPKCPASVRAQFLADVELELLPTFPATPEAEAILVDTVERLVYVGTVKPPVLDAIAKALADAKIAVDRRTVLDSLGGQNAVAAEALGGPPPGEEFRWHMVYGAAGSFLVWLWHRYLASSSGPPKLTDTTGAEWSWSLQKGLAITDDVGQPRLVVHHSESATDPVVKVALLDGGRVQSATVELAVSGIKHCVVKLDVKECELRIAGVELDLPKSAEPIEAAQSLHFEVSRAVGAVYTLLGHYGELRANPDRLSQSSKSLHRWMEGKLGEWATANGVEVRGA